MENSNLLRNSLDNHLQIRIQEIEDKIEPLLERTTNINTDYTEHNVKHSLRIEQILSNCIAETHSILGESEKFILIVSTLIHDIGMTGQGKYKDDPDYGKEIRDSHQSRSAEFIKKYGTQIGLINREIEAIAVVSEGHRLLPLDSYHEIEGYGIGGTIRPRLLAALLRFADELDILEERAPSLVSKYLEVNEESLLHHQRHQLFKGIYRDVNSNTIILEAKSSNMKLLESIENLFDGVQEKFKQVKDVFNDAGINLSGVAINIDTTDITLKMLLLKMVRQDSGIKEEMLLSSFEGKDKIEAVQNLKRLKAEQIITGDELLVLSHKGRHFRRIFRTFLKSEYELKFTKSIYVRTYLENEFDGFVLNHFGVAYPIGDKDDRILLLTHFPKGLEYFFEIIDAPYKFGHMDRRVTLDLGLLHAVSYDCLRYPDELAGEVFLASQAVEKSVHQKVLPFFKLVSTLPEASKQRETLLEMKRSGIDPFEKNSKQGMGSFTINTSIAENQLPNMDFFTLTLASNIACVPVEFSKDVTLRDINFPEKPELPEIPGSFTSLTFYPQPNVQHLTYENFANFTMDKNRRELFITVASHRDELDSFPYQLLMEFKETGKISISSSATRKLSEKLKLEKMLNLWSSEGFRRLYITQSDGERILEVVPDKIDKLDSKFLANYDKLIKNSGTNIDDFSIMLNSNVINEIEKLDIDLKEKNDSLFKSLQKTTPKNQTHVFMHVIKNQKQILSSCYLGSFPYVYDVFKKLSIKISKNITKEARDTMLKGEFLVTTKKYITDKEFLDLYKSIKKSFKEYRNPLDRVLSVDLMNNGQTFTCCVSINFKPSTSDFWGNHKKIEIIIEIDENQLSLLNQINEFKSKGEFLKTIPLMEELQEDSMLEDLAFAYCLNDDFQKALNSAEKAIERNPRSVAQFTKGLALILSGNEDDAYEAYMQGAYLIEPKIWYPVAKSNMLEQLIRLNIPVNNKIKKIVDALDNKGNSISNRSKAKCYCNSGLTFRKCHGKSFYD